KNIFLIFFSKLRRKGVVTVHGFQRKITTYREGIFCFCLGIVEVHISSGSHQYIVMLVGGCNTTLLSAPAHDRGVLCNTAFEDLIPANDFFSFAVYIFFNPLDKITL